MAKNLKIGLILIALIIVFVLVKFFLLKKSPPTPSPPQIEETLSPEEVTTKYFSLELEKNRGEAEKYLFSDFTKVEILRENYQNIRFLSLFSSLTKEEGLPEYQIKNIQIKENEAELTLEVTTNKMEGTIFFGFALPREIVFKVWLIKEGDRWKIIKIDSPDLVLERKFGEEEEIIENIFIRPIKISDYQPKDIDIKPDVGFKFLSFLVEYENKSTNTIALAPPFGWTLIDKNKNIYNSFRHLTVGREIREVAIPPEVKLEPNKTEKVYFFFQVPKEIQMEEIVYKNLNKKVIFKID